MQEIYELRDMLCKELKKYGKKGDVSNASLDIVDKLAHAVKNLDKIIDEDSGDGYSQRNYNRMSYDDGMSYARGRGMNARRDSMGRYSRDGYSRDHELVADLKSIMNDAHDETVKQDIQRAISKIESM